VRRAGADRDGVVVVVVVNVKVDVAAVDDAERLRHLDVALRLPDHLLQVAVGDGFVVDDVAAKE
jgi:hypothetical protein